MFIRIFLGQRRFHVFAGEYAKHTAIHSFSANARSRGTLRSCIQLILRAAIGASAMFLPRFLVWTDGSVLTSAVHLDRSSGAAVMTPMRGCRRPQTGYPCGACDLGVRPVQGQRRYACSDRWSCVYGAKVRVACALGSGSTLIPALKPLTLRLRWIDVDVPVPVRAVRRGAGGA